MKVYKWFFLCIICIAILSCFDREHKKLIIGDWRATEWLSGGQAADYDVANTAFSFDENSRYTFTYAGNVESGKYFISNSQLYTTPDGGIAMMVKIVSLAGDSLILDMNRSGEAERLTLVKAQ